MAFCSACGKALPDAALFCPSCGASHLGAESLSQGTHHPNPALPKRNPNTGCGKALLVVGGIVLALIVGCSALAMLGQQTEKAAHHPTSHTGASRKYSEDALDKRAVAQLTRGLENVNNQYGEHLFSGSASVGHSRCTAQVDGNVYEAQSDQDKRIITQIVGTLCVASYRAPFGDKRNVRSLPDEGLFIEIDDLSGNEVSSDLWSRK